MESASRVPMVSPGRLWASRIVRALTVLFLLVDTIVKVLRLPPAVEGTVRLGYPESTVLGIGIIELVCLVVYLIPRTSILGAILLTGYLGGAVATHVRIGSPLLSHTLFPIYVGMLIWLALFLRDDRLRTLLPVRR
jgi:DoxX-like family